MAEPAKNGTCREIDGVIRVYYDGYWIKCYDPPADSWTAKKNLIDALTRRLFNHTEHGINIPGKRLDEAREAYEKETDPALKRVKSAMLAGALFNRAADIFTHLVELESAGVHIQSSNDLMRECGRCLTEALDFGRNVYHRSGDEGIDELWGEPFKAFTMPVDAFYQSRYIKIAMTMRDIDSLTGHMAQSLDGDPLFPGVGPVIEAFADAARRKCETLRTDPDIFDIWPKFVVAKEQLQLITPRLPASPTPQLASLADQGLRMIHKGVLLVDDITRARTPMPKSSREFIDLCDTYERARSAASAA